MGCSHCDHVCLAACHSDRVVSVCGSHKVGRQQFRSNDTEDDKVNNGGSGIYEYGYYASVKFDTAASMNMSGDAGRLIINGSLEPLSRDIAINGFNGAQSFVSAVGSNRDNKREYYVKDMPSNLVLLCASDGAAVLFKDGGVVVKLDSDELRDLKAYLANYEVVKRLKVKNRTYEVDESAVSELGDKSGVPNFGTETAETANSGTATRYFNTKVNVSNGSQRVLTMLLTGLTFNDLYVGVKNGCIDGMPPDLSLNALNHFEHKYGRTPDIIRMAVPINNKSQFGLMSGETVVRKGQRVEIDVMFSD